MGFVQAKSLPEKYFVQSLQMRWHLCPRSLRPTGCSALRIQCSNMPLLFASLVQRCFRNRHDYEALIPLLQCRQATMKSDNPKLAKIHSPLLLPPSLSPRRQQQKSNEGKRRRKSNPRTIVVASGRPTSDCHPSSSSMPMSHHEIRQLKISKNSLAIIAASSSLIDKTKPIIDAIFFLRSNVGNNKIQREKEGGRNQTQEPYRRNRDLSAGSLSKSTLDCLESIKELDHATGIRILAFIPATYTFVVVPCMTRLLKDESPQEQDGFVDAVNCIWKGKVSDMRLRIVALG
ncbi:hypothetical protein ACLOJK_028673 [Asimina triloba]